MGGVPIDPQKTIVLLWGTPTTYLPILESPILNPKPQICYIINFQEKLNNFKLVGWQSVISASTWIAIILLGLVGNKDIHIYICNREYIEKSYIYTYIYIYIYYKDYI